MERVNDKEASQKFTVRLDPDLAALAPDFLARKRRDLERISSALQRGEFDLVASIAHTIKGEGGTLGFDMLSEYAAELEEAAKSRDHAKAQRWVASIADYLARVCVEPANESDRGT